MALWKNITGKVKAVHNAFWKGLNADPFFGYEIDDNELTYMIGMSDHKAPAIATRERFGINATAINGAQFNYSNFSIGASFHYPVSAPHARSGKIPMFVTASTTAAYNWAYWNYDTTAYVNLSTSLTSTGEYACFDFNTGTEVYTLLADNTSILKYLDGKSTSSTAYNFGDASTPYTSIMTSHKGRVYAGKGNKIYYSALNSIQDWTTAGDAGNLTVTNANGNIVAIVSLNGRLIILCENSIHELIGTGPQYFELVDLFFGIGASSRSTCINKQSLYFIYKSDVYRFSGSYPEKISNKIEKEVKRWTGHSSINKQYRLASKGDYIYFMFSNPVVDVSLWYDLNNRLFQYNTITGSWFSLGIGNTYNAVDFLVTENSTRSYGSTNIHPGSVYFLYNLGLRDMFSTSHPSTDQSNNSTEVVSWEIRTKNFPTGVDERQTLSEISLIYDSSGLSTCLVSYSYNMNQATTNYIARTSDFVSDSSKVSRTLRIKLNPAFVQNVPYYHIRINGSGKFILHRMERIYRVNSR